MDQLVPWMGRRAWLLGPDRFCPVLHCCRRRFGAGQRAHDRRRTGFRLLGIAAGPRCRDHRSGAGVPHFPLPAARESEGLRQHPPRIEGNRQGGQRGRVEDRGIAAAEPGLPFQSPELLFRRDARGLLAVLCRDRRGHRARDARLCLSRDAGQSRGQRPGRGSAEVGVLGIEFAATVAVAVFVTRKAREKLRQAGVGKEGT